MAILQSFCLKLMQLVIIPLTYLCRCKTKVHDATSLLFAFLLPNDKVILTNTKKKWLKLHQNHLCKHFRTTNSRFGDCEKRFAKLSFFQSVGKMSAKKRKEVWETTVALITFTAHKFGNFLRSKTSSINTPFLLICPQYLIKKL